MKRVLLCLLICSCADAPATGHIYACEGVFTCLGEDYKLTKGTGCAESSDEAQDLYTDHILEIVKTAQCGDSWQIAVTCENTGKVCVH